MRFCGFLILHALRVCSPEFLDQELEHIKFSLTKLAYPDHVLKKAYLKARRTHFTDPAPLNDSNVDATGVKGNIVVPYVPTLKKFKLPHRNLERGLIFQYKNKLSSSLDKNSPAPIEAGVYKIPCKVCPKIYVGETGRTLPERISEHKGDIKKSDPNLSSGVVNHVFETGHLFDFDKAEILYYSNDTTKRHLVESAFIINHSGQDLTVNLNNGFSPHNKILSKLIFDLIPKNTS